MIVIKNRPTYVVAQHNVSSWVEGVGIITMVWEVHLATYDEPIVADAGWWMIASCFQLGSYLFPYFSLQSLLPF